MSDKNKKASGRPWSTLRTPPRLSKSLTQDEDVSLDTIRKEDRNEHRLFTSLIQVEDVSQDTIRKEDRISVENTTRESLRNTVEDTTGIPLSNSNEDPRTVKKDLEEKTSEILLATEVGRGIYVENTTRTPSGLRDQEENTSNIIVNHKKEQEKNPMKNRVGARNPEIDTPRIPLNIVEEGQKDPRISTSPATSTPGASPIGSTLGELRYSELQSSEESVIESSITKDESKREEENEDLVIIKMISTSLAENSEVEEEDPTTNIHSEDDSEWETTLGETTLKEGEVKSCIAKRTRSQTEHVRKLNLSQLLETYHISMTESFEVIENNAMDSLKLPKYGLEGTEWEDRKKWCGNLNTLNKSLDKASRIKGTQKQEEIMKIYKKKTAEVAKENEEMKNTYEDATISTEEEEKKAKSVTFMVEEPKYTSAMEEVIKALETLVGLNLNNAPINNIENIIKIILSICIDYSAQVQATQETMRTMAKLIRELLINRYRVELMNEEIRKIEKEKEAAVKEVQNFKLFNKALMDVTHSVMDVEKNENRNIVEELAGCRAQITELERTAVEREVKYTNAYSRKEFYKEKTDGLVIEVAELKERIKKEANERQTTYTEMEGLLNGYESMKERADKVERIMIELKTSHETDIKNIKENQAAQEEREKRRKQELEKKVIDQGVELRKVRNEYNKLLRTRDDEIKEANKKIKEDKITLDEQEKANGSLWDLIDNQREEMETISDELESYKDYNLLFGEKNTKIIYDPENPLERFRIKNKTKTKTTEERDEGMGSEINTTTDVSNADFQSSTAGVLGDTDGCMDTTVETQTTIQRGSKRKKEEMAGAEKMSEKERIIESSEESCSTFISEDEKEPSKKKKLSKNKTDNRKITQKELDKRMVEIKEEHLRQLEEQKKKNEENIETLKREMEMRSRKDIESLRQSIINEGIEQYKQKPEEVGREEPVEGTMEVEVVQDPLVTSQEREVTGQTTQEREVTGQTITHTQPQNSGLGRQTSATQDSVKQGQAVLLWSDPSTQDRDEGNLNLNSDQTRPMGENTLTQNRAKGRPYVEKVTEENRHRVSKEHKGMLLNLDGTLTMTPQYCTWALNSSIQIQEMYDTMPEFPPEITNRDHPDRTRLHLVWSHEGEWIPIPYDKYDEGPNYRDSRIARLERYIDIDGKIRRAVSYGEEEAKLNVWFDLDDIKAAFPNWQIPTPSLYYNGKRFNPNMRRKGADNPGTQPNPQPRDQSDKDIQGRKGKYQANKNRGYKGRQYRENTQEYQNWDRQQRAGTSTQKRNHNREQESWNDYKMVPEEGSGSRPKDHHSRDQSWDQRQSQNRQYSGPSENYQRDSEERRRDRGSQSQEYDFRESQQGYQTKEYEERRRYREDSRNRQGDRRQREKSMSPRRQRNRSPSPLSSGRGRGGGQRERNNETWSNNDGGRGRDQDRRGNDAGYGGS